MTIKYKALEESKKKLLLGRILTLTQSISTEYGLIKHKKTQPTLIKSFCCIRKLLCSKESIKRYPFIFSKTYYLLCFHCVQDSKHLLLNSKE